MSSGTITQNHSMETVQIYATQIQTAVQVKSEVRFTVQVKSEDIYADLARDVEI